MSTFPKESHLQYKFLIDILYPLTLCSATVLMSYPLWAHKWKETNFIAICWNSIIFFVLICFSFLIVLISNFSEVQFMVFMINILIVSSLINWRWNLFYLVFGVFITLFIYEKYLLPYQIQSGLYGLKFKIVYLVLLVSSVLIMFLKPKQQYLEETEERAEYFEKETDSLKKEIEYSKREFDNFSQGLKTLEEQFEGKEGVLKEKEMYLKDQLKIRNIEISKLKDVKDEFIRNVMHESNTPLTGILSLCDILHSYYDKLDKKNIKQSIKDIVNSGDRLKTYVNNIADLSKLSSLSYELNKEKINLSKLIKERTVLYKKIFVDDTKKQKFKFEIEKDIITECDEYYITQAIDNLISNAVKYGEGNPITINLIKNKDNEVQFKIIDSGVGIPENELISIFDKFTVSSKTKSSAEGRGIGLALCEKIIKVHNGRIWAKQNPDKGVTFVFTLFA